MDDQPKTTGIQALPEREEAAANPMLAFRELCIAYHRHEALQMLWDWFETAMTRHHSIYDMAKERSSSFTFYKLMEGLINAAYDLQQQPVNRKTKKTTNKGARPSTT